MIETIFVLLVIFQLKHFFADFPLQNVYMFGKGNAGWDFVPPLLAHALVHATLSFIIAYWFTGAFFFSFALGLFDLVIHFIMDRIKAGPKYLGRYGYLAKHEFSSASEAQLHNDKKFWVALGFDQMVHHLTHFAIIHLIVTHA